jgi:hypothetical protein
LEPRESAGLFLCASRSSKTVFGMIAGFSDVKAVQKKRAAGKLVAAVG